MPLKIKITISSLLLLISSYSMADTSLGIGLSTLGANIKLAQSLSHNINLRLEYNGASYDTDGATNGVDYNLDLDLSSIGLLFDWHALNNGFRVTLGGLYNDNRLSANSNLNGANLEVGDMTFTSAQVGQLQGDISFNSFSPYLGVGWGRAVHQGYSFNFDLGVVFQGKPDVDLRSVGGLFSNNALLLSEIETEERELQDDLDIFELYPVISFGLSYTF